MILLHFPLIYHKEKNIRSTSVYVVRLLYGVARCLEGYLATP